MGWTTEQEQCFTEKSGSLLVSAAAGSGKTSVLIERIFRRITRSDDPLDIDSLIVTTFTEAAAREMKQRLYQKLSEAIKQDPQNKRLQHQLFLLPHASITTIDGFCTTLLREHAHEVGISPDYTILEEQKATILWDEALEEVIEEFYAAERSEFVSLMRAVCTDKDDAPLKQAAETLHRFIDSHAFPDEWITSQLQEMNAQNLWDTSWGRSLRQFYLSVLQKSLDYIDRAIEIAKQDMELSPSYAYPLERYRDQLATLLLPASFTSWDGFWACVYGVKKPELPKKEKNNLTADRIHGLCSQSWDALISLYNKKSIYSDDEIRKMLTDFRPLIVVLWELVQATRKRFSEKKLAIQSLDFADLEQLTMSLLWEKSEGKNVPSALAHDLAAQYAEIYVDEYQDCNEIQEQIFTALAKDTGNLFFVGDVKQSIYGFRQARPELFIARRRSYPLFDGNHFPATILLNHNFRSRKEVTDAVNFLFCQLMTEETCQLAYQGNEELCPAADYSDAPHDESYRTSLLVVDMEDCHREKHEQEATVIASEIRRHMEQSLVKTKDGTYRKPQYSDFCILLGVTKNISVIYADMLNRLGIPASGATSLDFFDTKEISLAISYLRIIDNPLLEVPLTAVLMSPLCGLTPDDLTAIRLHTPNHNLYTALERYARTDTPLASQIRAFLQDLVRYRTLAATLPAHRLLQRIYDATGIVSLMAANTNGEQRRANLQLLYEQARLYEERGFRGLSAFVRHLQKMRTQENHQVEPATLPQNERNAVQIMTIHHSKGLEFPFVFVADLSHEFNKSDTYQNIQIHCDAGIGLRVLDEEKLVRKNPPMLEGVVQAAMRSLRTERLRLLYVAATRAREQLTFVTSLSSHKSLTGLAALVPENGALPTHAVLNVSSFAEWVLMAALRHPSATALRELAAVEHLPLYPADDKWDVRIISPTDEEESAASQEEAAALPPPDMALANILQERLAYTYPYAALGTIPNKLTASSLSHRKRDHSLVATSCPAFLMQDKMSAADRGTAMHAFMQFADFAAAAADLEGEIARLQSRRLLTAEQASSLSRSKLAAFFRSDLYRRMCAADRMWRELPFTVGVPARELEPETCAALPPDAAEEEIVVQGIADCVFEEHGKLVIVDYKTDRIRTGEELSERYHAQLEMYATALSRSMEIPVGECLLYSFALDKTVPVILTA